MTSQIVTAIDEALKPRGVAMMIEAEHMCMSMRGVQKQGSTTITTQLPAYSGMIRPNRCGSSPWFARGIIVLHPCFWTPRMDMHHVLSLNDDGDTAGL